MNQPGETPSLSTYEEADTCPLPQAHGRLSQAHRLWHLLQAAYPRPDDFVLQLNAAIEGFRNVTFILQNEMKSIPNADVWYKSWQMQMRTDSVMRWLHDSRTKVVHKGDLATHSTAIFRIHADWYGPHEVATFSVPPLVSTETLAATFAGREDLKESCGKSPILEVERRWVEDGLPDWEILAALSHCYGVLWQLLADGHTQAGLTMRDIHEGQHSGEPRSDLDNRPACMLHAWNWTGPGRSWVANRAQDFWKKYGSPLESVYKFAGENWQTCLEGGAAGAAGGFYVGTAVFPVVGSGAGAVGGGVLGCAGLVGARIGISALGE